MIRRFPLLLAFAMLAFAMLAGACQGLTEPQRAELGEPFWLRYHEDVIVPTSAGTLRFAEMLEDSRCPSDEGIVCVWAGRVRIQVSASGFGTAGTVHELRLLDEPGSIRLGGFVIDLLDVDPPRFHADPAPRSRYRAQLVITAVR